MTTPMYYQQAYHTGANEIMAGFFEPRAKIWKLEGEKVTGPLMEIGRLPIFQVNLVIGI